MNNNSYNQFAGRQTNRTIFVLIIRTIYMMFLGGILYRGLVILENKGAFELPFGTLLLIILVTVVAIIVSAVQYVVTKYRELSEVYGTPQSTQNKGCSLKIVSFVLFLFITSSFAAFGYSSVYDLINEPSHALVDAVVTKVSDGKSAFKLIPFGNKEANHTYEFDYYYDGKEYTAVYESNENFEIGESISVFVNTDYPEKAEIYSSNNNDKTISKILFTILGWCITLRLFFPNVWISDDDSSGDYDDD